MSLKKETLFEDFNQKILASVKLRDARFKIVIDILKQLKANDEKANRLRGEIVNSIIQLDELMEEIILLKFINEYKRELFAEIFLDEMFSSGLKWKILKNTGIFDSGLASEVQLLIELRNSVAHSKYTLSIYSVEILHKRKEIKDLLTLEQEFSKTRDLVFEKLNKIIGGLENERDKNPRTD